MVLKLGGTCRWDFHLAAFAILLAGAVQAIAATDRYELQLGDEAFLLEIAADRRTQYYGLGGRESIDRNGGMIFVFANAKARSFVMRDCLIPIDILFLDSSGLITATYTMHPEAPRAYYESEIAYTQRLRRYHSLGSTQYAIELRAGTMDRLGLQQGDRVKLDTYRLQRALN